MCLTTISTISNPTMFATKPLPALPNADTDFHHHRGRSDQQHDEASISVSIAAAHAARHARRHSEHVAGHSYVPRRPTARDDSYFPYYEWTSAASAGTSTLPTTTNRTHTRTRRGRSPDIHLRAALTRHSDPKTSYVTPSPEFGRPQHYDEDLRRDSLESMDSGARGQAAVRNARTRQDSQGSYFSDDSDSSSESDCDSDNDVAEAEVRHAHKTSAVQVSHAIVVVEDADDASLGHHFSSCTPLPPASQPPAAFLYHTTPSPTTSGSCGTPTMDEVVDHVARVMRSNSRRGRLQAVHLHSGAPPTLRRKGSIDVV